MKILLINNYSQFFDTLKGRLSDHDVTVASFDRECIIGLDEFDCIILSGGSRFEVMENEDMFQEEMRIIRNSRKPILGICLGLQIIGRAFDENIVKLDSMIEGPQNIEILKDDVLFSGFEKGMKVFQSHEWGMKEAKNLIPIAKSEHCIEAFKHPDKIIYGVQFHPEVVEGNDGIKILENFLKLAEGLYA